MTRGRQGSQKRAIVLLRTLSLTSAAGLLAAGMQAQTCLTQSKLLPAERDTLGSAAYTLATAVQANDSARVQASTIPPFATDFASTSFLIRSTSEPLHGDTLAVTQLYVLDAGQRKANDTSDADFSCLLAGTASEADFSIPGLPPGRYAFAMVEASGVRPWLLSFLLQDVGGTWKMAGFYPHDRSAAGHDGLWYWNAARSDAKANKPWLAWVLYSEADQLLRPAGFVSTTNLDKLRTEQRSAAPPALASGISIAAPLTLPVAGGTSIAVTDLSSLGSEDGHGLDLVLHVHGDAGTDSNLATQRNLAAAQALLSAHPELRQGFDNITVVADAAGGNPFIVKRPVNEISGTR